MAARFRHAFISACILVAVASAMGMVFNVVRHSGIPLVGDWNERAMRELHAGGLEIVHVDEAHELLTLEQAIFIDARDRNAFASGRIPGSVNISPDEAVNRQDEIRTMLRTGKILIAYCYDVDCPLGTELAKKLRDIGIGPVKVMPEGWTGWLDRGYPYE